MKIVFLDIDGVLVTRKSLAHDMARRKSGHPANSILTMFSFDAGAVAQLNWLIRESGAKLVISSVWRKNRTVGQLRDIFKAEGIEGDILGATVTLNDAEFPRGTEIQWWLKSSRHHVEEFVIIDDDTYDILPVFPDKLVKTDTRAGLTRKEAEAALQLLKGGT